MKIEKITFSIKVNVGEFGENITISQTIDVQNEDQEKSFKELVDDSLQKAKYVTDRMGVCQPELLSHKKKNGSMHELNPIHDPPSAAPTLPYQPVKIPSNPNPSSWMSLSNQDQNDIVKVMGNFPKIKDFEGELPEKIDENTYNKIRNTRDDVFDKSILDLDLPEF